MKVVQVTPRYAPQTGGVETHVQQLGERLSDRGHEVTVLTTDARGHRERRERRNGVRVRRFHGVAPNDAFFLAPGLVPAVRRSDADLVHAHNVHALPLPLAAVASSVPVVATPYYHGKSADRWRNVLWRAYRPVAGALLRRASLVTSVSEWERRSLNADFGVDATVIPIGIDRETFASATPIERERPFVLCVSRLEEYKGIQYAIRALAELEEFELVVAGDGPFRFELERLAGDCGVAERVEFLGEVDHDELPAYYAGAEAYVSLSSFESFGITVAEALASGTPVVVWNSTALSDWTDRSDVIGVDSVDVEAVVGAVESAVGRKAPTAAIASWQDTADRYERCYETVVESGLSR